MSGVNIPYRDLPAVAAEYLASYDSTQVENFRSRLRYVEEITSKVDEWLEEAGGND